MKFLSALAATLLTASVATAAVNTGLPSKKAALPYAAAKETPHSDMATADRLLETRQYARAIPVLERIVNNLNTTEQNLSVAYNLKGLSLYMVGRIAESVPDFTRSVELQRKVGADAAQLWKTIFNRGLAYEAMKDLSNAANDYVRAYALAPDNTRVRMKVYTFFNKE